MKTRLERNKKGDTEINLEVASLVLMRDDSDMAIGNGNGEKWMDPSNILARELTEPKD